MTTAATSLLGLALPVTGELQGTWGTTVNDSITSLLDTAIAGTTTLSTDGDVTLTTTTLAANQARQAILLCSGARTAIRTITAPAQSKIYTIINATTGGYAVKIVGVGPTTGISIPAGQTATVAWNGSDFVDASNYTNGNKVINGNLTVTGTTTLSGGTANGVAYLNGSKVVTTGSALTFDGTTLVSSRGASNGIAAQFGRSSGQSLYVYADTTSVYLGSDNGANTAWQLNETSDYIAGWLGGSEQMRLTSTGLGIGTSSPGQKLDVVGSAQIGNSSTSASVVRLYNTASNLYIGVDSSTGNNTGVAYNQYFLGIGAYPMTFWTNSTERMRIDSSGNLGLGVTPSAWGSNFKAIDVGTTAAFYAAPASGVFAAVDGNNYSTSGGAFYKTNGFATRYFQLTTGGHAWYTAPSGTAGNAITFTQAMTLTAAGRLGLGLTSPSTLFEAYGGAAGTSSELTVGNASTAARFGVDTSNEVTVATGQAVPIKFLTSNTERARIDSSGNLLVGTTDTSGTNTTGFEFFYGSGSSRLYMGHVTGTVSGTYYHAFNYDGTTIGSITQSGTTAVLYNTTSDQRLKENIADADSASTLIDSLQVRKFDWKSDGSHQRYGFVAQELVTVAPEAVHQPADPEEMMAVDYSKLVPMLVKEIQSLRARVAQLESN